MSKVDAAASTPSVLTRLLVAIQPSLYLFVCGLVGDREQARDLVQEVFCAAWRAAQQDKRPFNMTAATYDEAAIRRWLFHAAYCDAATALRHRNLFHWESLDALVVPDSATRLPVARSFEDAVAEREVLRAALAALAPEEAACLLLNVLQGFTAAEIAAIMGISREACKKRLTRALHRLRTAYAAQHQHPDELQESPS